MARLLAAVLTAVLLFATVPAAFGDEISEESAALAAACDNPDGLEVLTADGLDSEIAAPSFTEDAPQTKQFLVDLADEETAVVDVTMTWDVLTNDYDLAAATDLESVLSENSQPLDEAAELASLGTVADCDVITVTASNFLAPVEADTLSLELRIGEAFEATSADGALEVDDFGTDADAADVVEDAAAQ